MNQSAQSAQPVALVTGASRGIGRAVALELASAGYSVAVNYRQRADAAAEVVHAIESGGGKAMAIAADVARTADRAALVDQALARFGRIDVLVNNAGIVTPGRVDLLELTEASYDEVLATNLKGPFFLAQLVASAMIERIRAGAIPGGVIVNISSISAFTVSTNRGDYCLAKAAQQMLTWLFAARLAEEKIRVYEVCPGIIATDMTAPVRDKYERQIAEGLSPIRRWGEGSDVARVVRALAGGDFAFATGERIHVDGGFHIRRL